MIDLYYGDCLEIMDELIEEGVIVDAIITDPPYGTTVCSWDSVIPLDEMWERLNKLIKPNGAVVLFGSEPFSSALRMSNIKNYKYDWIWDKIKQGGHVHGKNMPLKQHEIISIFSNGVVNHASLSKNRMEYYPQGLIKNGKKSKNYSDSKTTFYGYKNRPDDYIVTHTNYPKSILTFSNANQIDRVHPTQKPIELMEYLIKTYTNEDEIVLDFTMGSGSTMVACKQLNRKGIGIELDKDYFKIAEDRIKEASNKALEAKKSSDYWLDF